MFKTVMVLTLAAALSATSVGAQQTSKPDEKTPAAAAKAEPRATSIEPLPVNIRIEVVITDQAGPGETAKKTVSMIVGDRQQNSIRTSAEVRTNSGRRPVGINVDARPAVNQKEPTKVQLMFGLEYSPKSGSAGATDAPEPNSSSLSQRLTLNLESGKPLLVSQAADPASDRKITVEVTATILK